MAGRVTQQVVEVAVAPSNANLRVTQVVVEVLRSVADQAIVLPMWWSETRTPVWKAPRWDYYRPVSIEDPFTLALGLGNATQLQTWEPNPADGILAHWKAQQRWHSSRDPFSWMAETDLARPPYVDLSYWYTPLSVPVREGDRKERAPRPHLRPAGVTDEQYLQGTIITADMWWSETRLPVWRKPRWDYYQPLSQDEPAHLGDAAALTEAMWESTTLGRLPVPPRKHQPWVQGDGFSLLESLFPVDTNAPLYGTRPSWQVPVRPKFSPYYYPSPTDHEYYLTLAADPRPHAVFAMMVGLPAAVVGAWLGRRWAAPLAMPTNAQQLVDWGTPILPPWFDTVAVNLPVWTLSSRRHLADFTKGGYDPALLGTTVYPSQYETEWLVPVAWLAPRRGTVPWGLYGRGLVNDELGALNINVLIRHWRGNRNK